MLIITDRTELDEQIDKVFTGVEEKIHKAEKFEQAIKKKFVDEPGQ